MTAPEFLLADDRRKLAYHRTAAIGEGRARPGVVFLGGFQSDMTGTKATYLEDWARRRGRAFLRFDYTGHGASSGRFEDGCVGDWTRDASEAIGRLTEGPQILVGSSMGGWIALLLARARPERVAGLVGVAAAPDFTEDLMWAEMDAATRERLGTEGRLLRATDYGPDPQPITLRLIEEGRSNLVLRAPLAAPFPVRLLQGDADTDVPIAVALRLLSHLDGPDVRLTLVKAADHRFSAPEQLALIAATIEGVDAPAGGAGQIGIGRPA
jgi:pimeloyl-ACP methyl ester carboxylesterase